MTGGAQVIIPVTGSQEGNRAPLQGSTSRLGGVGNTASGLQAANAEMHVPSSPLSGVGSRNSHPDS